jgi:uncharacterized protein YoxC
MDKIDKAVVIICIVVLITGIVIQLKDISNNIKDLNTTLKTWEIQVEQHPQKVVDIKPK